MSTATPPARGRRHQGPTGANHGDSLVRLGGIVFLVGGLAVVATVVPFLFGWSRLPTAAYLLSMLAPVGLGLALLGLLRGARARRRPPDASEIDLHLPL